MVEYLSFDLSERALYSAPDAESLLVRSPQLSTQAQKKLYEEKIPTFIIFRQSGAELLALEFLGSAQLPLSSKLRVPYIRLL